MLPTSKPSGRDLAGASETAEIEITPEMIEAAMVPMRSMSNYAWEYVDEEIVREMLRAALSRLKRAT